MMTAATKGTLMGAAFGAVVWAGTGTWQFFVVTLAGAMCTWMFTHPGRPQPRVRVREGIRVHLRPAAEAELRARYGELPSARKLYEEARRLYGEDCYDYGGCKWAGDGAEGLPLVLRSGEGCVHTGRRSTSKGKRCPDEDATENGGYLRRHMDCNCDNVPCTCSARDLMVGRMWRRNRHAACECRGWCTC